MTLCQRWDFVHHKLIWVLQIIFTFTVVFPSPPPFTRKSKGMRKLVNHKTVQVQHLILNGIPYLSSLVRGKKAERNWALQIQTELFALVPSSFMRVMFMVATCIKSRILVHILTGIEGFINSFAYHPLSLRPVPHWMVCHRMNYKLNFLL